MSLIRFAPAAVAALVLVGCQNAPEDYIEPERRDASEVSADGASMAELIDRNLKTSELTVGRLKDPSKTVGFSGGSTEVGEKLLDGALVVDQVARQDADNHFGVTVWLFNNRDDGAAVFEWRIAFLNDKGVELGSMHSGWKAKSVEAKRWTTISNFATVRGATKFKVETRPPGSEPEPAPQ